MEDGGGKLKDVQMIARKDILFKEMRIEEEWYVIQLFNYCENEMLN